MLFTMKQYRTGSPEETMEIGYVLGRQLRRGDTVGLYGDLGAGKTVFVKGIARAFGINERDVTSASFTIIMSYETSPPFTHIDLYRIAKTEELHDIGISDYLGGDGVTVIEWAEKAEGWLPDDHVAVRLRCTEENAREITIEGLDEKDRDNIEGRAP
jgi:tRNA threonylcarbamoyladenosine biosynthesis protein TsaE